MKRSLFRRSQQQQSFSYGLHPLKFIVSAAICFAAAAYLAYCYAVSHQSILSSQVAAAMAMAPKIASSAAIVPQALSPIRSPMPGIPSQSDAIWNETKTLRGDNLLPTPWHPFHILLDSSPGEKGARIQCTLSSCSSQSEYASPQAECSSPDYSAESGSPSEECPGFFHWIHEDLSPWREPRGGKAGITPELLERAKKFAAFRVVISSGKLYVDLYYHCVQSRSLFTIWGLLLLLERFPGQVPDVDFMFNCMDRPHFMRSSRKKRSPPPPLLAYCGSKRSYDIPFPDWSYWGWAELNIGPWDRESSAVFRGSGDNPWIKRRPAAQWKGNPFVGADVRKDLLGCNNSIPDAAEIYVQDWNAEARQGYKNSKLPQQCANRYKIYAEGHAWSVSFKYIMACGSTLLMINPEYHDFFMRGLLPKHHYWPIDREKENLCPSIQAAVHWGNKHPKEAEAIGKRGQDFLRHDLSMDHVYDYMLRLLQEYAKLQTFRPIVPPGAQLVCKASVLCMADPIQKKFLEQSLDSTCRRAAPPCRMPRPSSKYLEDFKRRQAKGFRSRK